MVSSIKLSSTITCPECRNKTEEIMKEDSCLIYYECRICNAVLRPLSGDCCIFCSYGNIPCPPVQITGKCC